MAHMIGKAFLGYLNVFHGRILQEKFARPFMKPTLEREQLDGTLKHQRSHGVSKNNHLTLFFSASYLDPLVLVAKLQLQFYGELDVFRKIRTLPQQKESSKKHTSFRCKSRC